MNNSVAIWVGRFDSNQELQDYLDIDYAAEQDNSEYMASEFAEAFKIFHHDEDFREAYRAEAEPVSWAGLAEPLSYAEGFAHTVPNITDRNNSIIALYNYTYPGTVHGTENVLFVGNYTY